MDRARIENALLEMGIPAGVYGFKYIIEAVLLIDTEQYRNTKIVSVLYPTIAKKCNSTSSRVERAIRHAFEIARSSKDNYDAVEHYIGFMNCQNSNSLKMLHMRIKQECEKSVDKIDTILGDTLEEDKIRRIVREELKKVMGGIE